MQGRTLYWLWLLCSINCSLYPAGASVSSSVKWQQQHLPEERMAQKVLVSGALAKKPAIFAGKRSMRDSVSALREPKPDLGKGDSLDREARKGSSGREAGSWELRVQRFRRQGRRGRQWSASRTPVHPSLVSAVCHSCPARQRLATHGRELFRWGQSARRCSRKVQHTHQFPKAEEGHQEHLTHIFKPISDLSS